MAFHESFEPEIQHDTEDRVRTFPFLTSFSQAELCRSAWTATLDESLRAQGMDNDSMDRFDFDRCYLPVSLDTALLTWEEFTNMVVDRIGAQEGKQVKELITRAYEVGRQGGAWQADRVVAIGQKTL